MLGLLHRRICHPTPTSLRNITRGVRSVRRPNRHAYSSAEHTHRFLIPGEGDDRARYAVSRWSTAVRRDIALRRMPSVRCSCRTRHRLSRCRCGAAAGPPGSPAPSRCGNACRENFQLCATDKNGHCFFMALVEMSSVRATVGKLAFFRRPSHFLYSLTLPSICVIVLTPNRKFITDGDNQRLLKLVRHSGHHKSTSSLTRA